MTRHLYRYIANHFFQSITPRSICFQPRMVATHMQKQLGNLVRFIAREIKADDAIRYEFSMPAGCQENEINDPRHENTRGSSKCASAQALHRFSDAVEGIYRRDTACLIWRTRSSSVRGGVYAAGNSAILETIVPRIS